MTKQQKKRFLVIHLIPPNEYPDQAEKELTELLSLVDTYGGATIVKIIQRRMHPHNHTYIGPGKVAEVTEIIKSKKIEGVVINAIIKPTQLFHLTQAFWKVNPNILVWDRVDLILHIFEKHAHTAEAKLQIKLARMRHMGPRIYGLGGTVLSRQGGGIGTRGIGETNIERMKRHWKSEIKKVQNELDRITQNRQRQIDRRRKQGLQTVSIVGYTNAGKTTLFNSITKKKKRAANELFATLDATVGSLWLPTRRQEVLISDTIGFIQNLPASLVSAFRSTLMEVTDADLLLHVIDASDPEQERNMRVVQEVLEQIGVGERPIVTIFSKIDQLTVPERVQIVEQFDHLSPVLISASEKKGIPMLLEQVEQRLGHRLNSTDSDSTSLPHL